MFDFCESTLFADVLVHLGIFRYSDDKISIPIYIYIWQAFQGSLLKDASDHVFKV